jgi:hypothetical protein
MRPRTDLTAASSSAPLFLESWYIAARTWLLRRREVLGPDGEFTVSPVTSCARDRGVIFSFCFNPRHERLRQARRPTLDRALAVELISDCGSAPEKVTSSTNLVNRVSVRLASRAMGSSTGKARSRFAMAVLVGAPCGSSPSKVVSPVRTLDTSVPNPRSHRNIRKTRRWVTLG